MGIKSIRRKFKKLDKLENEMFCIKSDLALIFSKMVGVECVLDNLSGDGWALAFAPNIQNEKVLLWMEENHVYPNQDIHMGLKDVLQIIEEKGTLSLEDFLEGRDM